VHAGGQNREVSAVQDRNVANDYVAAKLQTDRLVPPAGFDRVARVRITKRRLGFAGAGTIQNVILLLCGRLVAAAHRTFAVNQSRSKDGDILEVLAPDQTVVPMAVTKILILVPLIRLRRVVLSVAVFWIGGENRRAMIEIKRDVALQMDRKAAIGPGR